MCLIEWVSWKTIIHISNQTNYVNDCKLAWTWANVVKRIHDSCTLTQLLQSQKFKLNWGATSIWKISSYVSTIQFCKYFIKFVHNIGKTICDSCTFTKILQRLRFSSTWVQQLFWKLVAIFQLYNSANISATVIPSTTWLVTFWRKTPINFNWIEWYIFYSRT